MQESCKTHPDSVRSLCTSSLPTPHAMLATTTPLVQVWDMLPGIWKLYRQLGAYGIMEGTSHFTPLDADQLQYIETGEAQYGFPQTYKTTRRYIFVKKENNIHIYIDDGLHKGDLLYTLEWEKPCVLSATSPLPCIATGTHVCKEDTYQARYQFFFPSYFSLCYRVKGPQKDYQIHSIFRKYT